jgi:hypothetical protein
MRFPQSCLLIKSCVYCEARDKRVGLPWALGHVDREINELDISVGIADGKPTKAILYTRSPPLGRPRMYPDGCYRTRRSFQDKVPSSGHANSKR